MERLYIIAPAYNEAQSIKAFIDDWYPVIESHDSDGSSRLLVIDDGSTDHTLQILREQASERPLLEVHTKENSGHGGTLMYGYRQALKSGADFIFQTDSDRQTSPTEFRKFWDLRNRYAAVFGYRPVRGDGTLRMVVEKVLCLILRMIFGVTVPDANAPFRLMNRRFLKEYLRKLPKNYALPNVMLTTFAAYYKENIRFLPISFYPPPSGRKNSINIKRIVNIGWHAIGDFLRLRRRMK